MVSLQSLRPWAAALQEHRGSNSNAINTNLSSLLAAARMVAAALLWCCKLLQHIMMEQRQQQACPAAALPSYCSAFCIYWYEQAARTC